ncbi:MAG: DNA repair and recombination protein RadB [Candidatus Altiarchaeales archaeon]|nr:DNA repair and recombination protein RadB [Candidatus Altiarchaeales archaeon]
MMIKINPAFDRLFGGGLRAGVLTQVYGPPGSGKTNLALIASAEIAKERKVIYVDPEGGFSTDRMRQITQGALHSVLDKILLVEPTTFEQQKKALERLEDLVPNEQAGLVVMDSIALLYRILEERDIRMYGRMLAQLLRIARKYEIPVLMTNQVYTNTDTGQITPVGGQINNYWSKVIVELTSEGSRRFAVIRKHLHHQVGGKTPFKIISEGIQLI